ncbi:hypothetical protein CS8_101380 [Cupriavidus sp. 8B]
MSKSLAGGLSLSAVCGRAEFMDAPAPGSLGGTYAGNPLAVTSAWRCLTCGKASIRLSEALFRATV